MAGHQLTSNLFFAFGPQYLPHFHVHLSNLMAGHQLTITLNITYRIQGELKILTLVWKIFFNKIHQIGAT